VRFESVLPYEFPWRAGGAKVGWRRARRRRVLCSASTFIVFLCVALRCASRSLTPHLDSRLTVPVAWSVESGLESCSSRGARGTRQTEAVKHTSEAIHYRVCFRLDVSIIYGLHDTTESTDATYTYFNLYRDYAL
jgi:hypothetical protein